MHLFHIPQCSIQNRNVHITVLKGALWDMEQMHSGSCESDRFNYNWVKLWSNKQAMGSRSWVLQRKWPQYIKDALYSEDPLQNSLFSARVKSDTPKLTCQGVNICMMTSSYGNVFRVTGHLCGNSPVNSQHKGQWCGALMFSLICVWING